VPKAARTSRTSWTWPLAGLGAVAAVALIVAIVINVGSGPSGTEPQPSVSTAPLVSIPPPPAVAPSPHAIPNDGQLPNTMTYLEPSDTGTLVKRIDLRTGRISTLFTAPGGQVALPVTGDRAAYVVSTPAPGPAPSGSPTPALPIVHVVDLRTGEDVSVGEGSGPVWSADGTHLAAIRQTPQGPEIVAMTTSDPQLRPITPWATEWTILGWAGDRVLLFGLPLRMYLASMDGGLQQLPTPNAEIHDPSPDGRWVFAVSGQGDAVFLRLGQSEPVVVDLGPWQLGNAHWTDNDLVVAAAATGTQIDAPSTVLVLDPAAGSMLKVSHMQGVVAAFPSSDGRSFVMARGKYPPTWKLWTCFYNGRCRRSGDVKIGVALEQLG
jgi:hypothetical protein